VKRPFFRGDSIGGDAWVDHSEERFGSKAQVGRNTPSRDDDIARNSATQEKRIEKPEEYAYRSMVVQRKKLGVAPETGAIKRA